MKKNFLVTLACITSLSVVLAGCGSSPKAGDATPAATEAASPKTDKKEVTLTVAASQNWIKEIDKKLAEQFTKESGIKVEFQLNPDDQYENVLKTKLATHEAADIDYVTSGIGMAKFQPDQNFMDLSKEPWVANLRDWAKQGASYNGKVYGFNTWSVDGWGILYNTDIFQKLGLQPPKNYAEFTKICDTLLANKITPIYENGKDLWHLPIWLIELSVAMDKENPSVINKLNDGSSKLADSKVLATALAQYNEMNKKGYFGKDVLSNEWAKGYDAMGTGKAAMMLVYTTYQGEVLAKFPDSGADKWKMFPNPLADNQGFAHSAGGIIRAVNKDTKNMDAIRKYFEFLAKPDNLKAFYSERKDLGQTSFKDVEVAPPTESFKSVKAAANGAESIDLGDSVMYWDGSAVGKGMQDLLLGHGTPESLLKSLDDGRAKTMSTVK